MDYNGTKSETRFFSEKTGFLIAARGTISGVLKNQ